MNTSGIYISKRKYKSHNAINLTIITILAINIHVVMYELNLNTQTTLHIE